MHFKSLFAQSFFAAIVSVALVSCGQPTSPSSSGTKEAWDAANDPYHLGNYQRNFASLPLSGNLGYTPWTDTYWPSDAGGLADRWLVPGQGGFNYRFLSREQVRSMSEGQLARLSPAEKYDILVGRYDYPLASSERARTNPNAAGWEGLCHGWASASYLYQEPKAIRMQSSEGVVVPFGSSDVKALLTYVLGQVSSHNEVWLGNRCNVDLSVNPGHAQSPECRDVNAGAFHVVLANQIGILREGFVADVTRDFQVWNQPVYAYTSEVVGYRAPTWGAAPGTVQEALVNTRMTYTVEVSANWNAVNGTSNFSSRTKLYQYAVELDAWGNIIGGSWFTEDRPDFLWKEDRPALTGYWQSLDVIYRSSVARAVDDPFPAQ